MFELIHDSAFNSLGNADAKTVGIFWTAVETVIERCIMMKDVGGSAGT